MKRKIRGFCRVLLLAASVSALTIGAALPQTPAQSLDELNTRILDNPQDVSLNLQYAAAAEAAGKPRLALAAYERILINDPTNIDARRGYERVRRVLEPGYTVARVEVGARWDSDPFNVAFGDEAMTYYGQLMVANEHQIFDRRWRTTLNVDLEKTPDIEVIDYDYIGAQTGPIFYVGPHLAAIPAIGVGFSWLGGDQYYKEVNLSLSMEGRTAGASYWWRLRGGYRDYNDDVPFFFGPIADHGKYVELVSGVVKPHLFSERDSLSVAPFVRWSDIEGSTFDFFVGGELSPGKYTEYGVDANYNYQLTDHIQASVGALVRERDFSGVDRNDTYVSPQASVSFQDVLPCNCDLKLQYRHRDNDSDDFIADYEANQVTLSLTTHF